MAANGKTVRNALALRTCDGNGPAGKPRPKPSGRGRRCRGRLRGGGLGWRCRWGRGFGCGRGRGRFWRGRRGRLCGRWRGLGCGRGCRRRSRFSCGLRRLLGKEQEGEDGRCDGQQHKRESARAHWILLHRGGMSSRTARAPCDVQTLILRAFGRSGPVRWLIDNKTEANAPRRTRGFVRTTAALKHAFCSTSGS